MFAAQIPEKGLQYEEEQVHTLITGEKCVTPREDQVEKETN